MARWPWQQWGKKTDPPEAPQPSPWQHLETIEQIQKGQDGIEPAPLRQLAQEHQQLFPKPSALHRRDLEPEPPKPGQGPVQHPPMVLRQVARVILAFWRGGRK